VEKPLSYQARREVLQQAAPQYREASSSQKRTQLDAFVSTTGYHRTYARWLLNHAEVVQQTHGRSQLRKYGPEVQHALFLAWHAANRICAKRLIPFLPTLIEALERHEHLHLTEECRRQVLSMSAATADRLLRSQRTLGQRGISTTRAGTLLKQQIPIRTFEEWKETRPGFLEADLVAHCGADIEGGYLYTLTLTDVATGWTECLPLLYRSQEAVLAALRRARTLFPFPILGIDTDNGGEFINEVLIAYCEHEQITFTRGRPYLKNDQCFVEQKNGAIVRQVVGYDRLVGEHTSATTHRTVSGTPPVCQLLPALDEAVGEATGWEKSALRLRPSQDPTAAIAPFRSPVGPETTRTTRGGAGARPHPPLAPTGAVAASRLPLCCRLLSLYPISHYCPLPRLFSRTLYEGKASCRGKRSRSGSRAPDPVRRAGAEKTRVGLAAYPQGPL
jgi:Integrase core domain